MRGCWKARMGWIIILSLLQNTFILAQQERCLKESFRLTLDNDFLNYRGNGTDRYYTNGMQVEYSKQQQNDKFFGAGILLGAGDESENIAQWSLTQIMFTPVNIRDSQVRYHDRPYAGALYLTRGRTTFNNASNLTVHSEINIGLIGPFSFANDVQTWVHRVIEYTKPRGWNNQIKTDIVINYNIDASRQILTGRKLQGDVQLSSRIGTLFNDLAVGFGIKAGKLCQKADAYQNNLAGVAKGNKDCRKMYFFSSAQLKLVLENSLLQGGFIQSFKNGCEDFYHLDESDIKRLLVTYETGVVADLTRWRFSVSENFISAEFKTAKTQLFGRITVIYRFI